MSISCAAIVGVEGTAIHGDAVVYNPALISLQSLSRQKQRQKVDGQEKAPPSTPHHSFLSMCPFSKGGTLLTHTGFSSFYPLSPHSLGFVLLWDLSKK